MNLKAWKILILASLGWLILAQSVECNYDGNAQYSSNNEIYGQSNGYEASTGENDGDDYGNNEGRPKMRFNFGVHVPAMKIQLPRMSLPKVTIHAKLKQSNMPSTINLPEINLETQSKISPPGDKSGGFNGGDGFGSNGGYSQGGRNSYSGESDGGYSQKEEGYNSNGRSPSSSSNYKSSVEKTYNFGRGNDHRNEDESTYLTASNDFRDGFSSISFSNNPDTKDNSYGSNHRYSKNNNKYQVGDKMRSNYATNYVNDQIAENYKSASTKHDVIRLEPQNDVTNSNYRVDESSVLLNFPDRNRSNQRTYKLDQSRSSSMIESQPNDAVTIKPIHLVYSAIQSVPDNEGKKHNNYNNIQSQIELNNFVPSSNSNSLYASRANMNFNRQGPRSLIQKISSPFVQVRNWLRPNNRE